MSRLRVVTLNTWKGDGAYDARVAAMAAGLRALSPDVVLLQEALRAPALGADTAARLGDALGLTVEFLPLRRKRRTVEGREADSWSGLALLSRRPILSARRIDLPGHADDGERAALAVEVDLAGAPFAVVNLHLTHLGAAGALRQAQLDAVLSAVGGEVLLGGDFNAPPGALGLPARGLVDLRADVGATPSPTCDGGCFDHLLRPVASRWRAVDLRPVLGAAEGGLCPSDHLGVLAEIAGAGSISGNPATSAASRPDRDRGAPG